MTPEPIDHPRSRPGMSPGSYRRWLIRIVLIALACRAGVLVLAEMRPAAFDFPDSHRYVRVARNIAAGLGPIDSNDVFAGTDPAYPLLLSAGVVLGIEQDAGLMRFGRIFNVILGIASVWLFAAFARRLVGDDRVGLIAAGILAVDPISVFFNALVLSETCYTALLLAALCALGELRRGDTRAVGRERPWMWAMFAGALLGLGTVTRSSALFLPIVLLPVVWHLAGGTAARSSPIALGRRLGVLSFFLLACAAVLCPTIIRNAGLFDRFVPVRTGSGASMMEALGPWADGAPGMDRIVYPTFPQHADEVQRDRLCLRAATDWACDHPARVLQLAWNKLRRTWSITINSPDHGSSLRTVLCWLTVAPEFALALCGFWMLRRRLRVLGLLLAPVLYFTLVHMVFVGSIRYRVPVMPMLFVAAAVALSRLGHAPKADRQSEEPR
jgi:hypothetical protein